MGEAGHILKQAESPMRWWQRNVPVPKAIEEETAPVSQVTRRVEITVEREMRMVEGVMTVREGRRMERCPACGQRLDRMVVDGVVDADELKTNDLRRKKEDL